MGKQLGVTAVEETEEEMTCPICGVVHDAKDYMLRGPILCIESLKAQLSEAQREIGLAVKEFTRVNDALVEAQEKLKQAHKWEELEAIETQKVKDQLAEAQREIAELKKTLDEETGNVGILVKRLSSAEGLLEEATSAGDNGIQLRLLREKYSAYKASNNKQEKKELDEDTIEDGFGSAWSRTCPSCGKKKMEIVRPGKVQCGNCG